MTTILTISFIVTVSSIIFCYDFVLIYLFGFKMALPWHIPLEAAPNLKNRALGIQATLHKHYCNLDIHGDPCEELQSGLMCEVGINNKDPAAIQRLIAAGMTIAQLNLRDMEPDGCSQLIQGIRQAVYNYSAELDFVYPLALIVEVRGPAITTGGFKEGNTLELEQYEQIKLTSDVCWRESGTADCLFVAYDHLPDLQVDDIIYIDSLTPGKVKLLVAEVKDDFVDCMIDFGGTISPKMTVRIARQPREVERRRDKGDSKESISSESSTELPFEHIEEQIAWAISSDIDGVLVPNTQSALCITHVREMLQMKGQHILVIASIETELAIEYIDEIIKESDGVYLDRWTLGTDLPIEKVFVAQKLILAKCSDAGKPCICKVVLNEHVPTLSVSDIGNLVLDGVDVLALDLQYQLPSKKLSPNYDALRAAEHCLAAANVIIRHAERIVWQPRIYGNTELMASLIEDPTKALCISAVEMSCRSRAVVIITLTSSGRTARILSLAKPNCPVLAVTRACHTARQLRFWRGVRAMHYFETAKPSWPAEVEARIHAAMDYCKAKRILKTGDPYVVVTGSRKGTGYSDNVRLLYASSRDTVPLE